MPKPMYAVLFVTMWFVAFAIYKVGLLPITVDDFGRLLP